MSRMLTLIHAGWASVRSLAKSGRRMDALALATRLLSRADLPVELAAEAHRFAADVLMEGERYADARRHLRAATALEPGFAKSYYLAGLAYERDPEGDDRRAALRFRKAAELEPANKLYQAAFGRAAVRCGRVNRGARELLAAADAAANNVAVLRVAVDGLIEAGKLRAARRVLVKARFRCPGDPELRRLWNRVNFETARHGQRATQDARFATDGDLRFLPFIRLVGAEGAGVKQVRTDVLSLPRPHLARFRATNADR